MEPNIDERLVKWDSILRELVVDVRELNMDLQESIRYIEGAGVLVISLGLMALFFVVRVCHHTGPSLLGDPDADNGADPDSRLLQHTQEAKVKK